MRNGRRDPPFGFGTRTTAQLHPSRNRTDFLACGSHNKAGEKHHNHICDIVKFKIENLLFGCDESIRSMTPPNGPTSPASLS
jgi:hypothetical protein